MQDEIRKSGIGVIGEVPWGTHFCQFYQTKQDLIDTLVPYFKAGLENNEFCMWVTADNLTVAEARKAMTKAVKGFSTYIKKGQIEILPFTEWYLRDGIFNSQDVLNGWIEKLNHALKKGYEGLRLTGNTFWLEKETWRSFAEYEAAVNNVIGKYKMIALCTYCLDKCNAAEIVDVIRNHEFALIKENGKWELFESSRYKNIKEELKENEKRFRLALKNAPVTLAAQDDKLRFLWAYNQRTVNPEAVLGKNDFEVFPRTDAEKLTALKSRVLQTGESINEKMWITSNEEKLFLDLFIEPSKDQSGKITGVEIATVDLTQMKQLEALLYSERDKLRLVLDSMEDGVCIIDQDYRVEYINPSLQAQFGKVEGKKCYQYLHDIQSGCSDCNIKDVIVSGKTIESEQKSSKTGQTHEISRTPLKNADGSISILAVFHDVTERKKAEEDVIRVNRELQAIRECDQAIVHSGNEITLLSDVCRILCTTAGYSLAWIGAIEYDKAKSVKPLVWQGDESYLAGVNVSWADTERGRGPTGMAIRTGKTHFFQDFATEPKAVPWREAALSRGYRSSIAIPLKEYNGNVFAVLCLYSPEPNSFNPAEVRLLEELGNDISFGVSALREKVKRQLAELELDHLASFPELNPNPILEIEENGQIKYLNPSAKVHFPDLSTSGIKHPFLADWDILAQTLKTTKLNKSITREIQVGEFWYEQAITYLATVRSYRIYARDVTERKKTEIVLKDNETRNRLILETALDGVWTNDLSGRILYVNDSYCQMIGYTREELLTMYIFDIEAIEIKSETKEHIDKVMRQGGDRFETRHIRKDGRIIDVEISVRYSNMGGGQLVVFARNITERKQAEDMLRETTNYLNNLLNYANAPVIVWDPHFLITRFNPAFERLTGYKSHDVVGLDLGILFPENKKSEILQQINRTLSGERWEVVEIPILRIDGEIRTVIWNSANVYDSDGKTIIATIAQGQDITERKAAEEAVKISETQYRRLFEAAKDGILIIDADTGLILDVNPFLVELLGLPYQEFIGKNLWELGYFRDIVASKANFSKLQKNSYIRYEDLPLRSVNGREMKVEFVCNIYKVDHRKIIQCNIRDITQRKQAEEEIKKLNEELKHRAAKLEVANKELEAFAYSVSHDLRAPLRSMEGFSQALQEDCKDILNDECKNYLRRIQNSAELMAQLIDDMLRLSRITRSDMDREQISLTEIARNIAARLKNDEPERNVKFVVTPGLTGYGDGKLIGIMMGNLFENAWKFTRKVTEAKIEFGVTERDGFKVYFIRDNGVGFDMKYVGKLFKPFQRLHSTEEFPGTGIGLASVQRIIQRHGGKVWAEGKTGEGATFYFTLG